MRSPQAVAAGTAAPGARETGAPASYVDTHVFTTTREFSSDVALVDNPSQMDGGFAANAKIDIGTVVVSDDHVIDASGTIHLHRDLVTDKNSDAIRSNSPVAASDRYQAEVQAVTGKLASLDFRDDPQGISPGRLDVHRRLTRRESSEPLSGRVAQPGV